jgi:hypothetical protein
MFKQFDSLDSLIFHSKYENQQQHFKLFVFWFQFLFILKIPFRHNGSINSYNFTAGKKIEPFYVVVSYSQ